MFLIWRLHVQMSKKKLTSERTSEYRVGGGDWGRDTILTLFWLGGYQVDTHCHPLCLCWWLVLVCFCKQATAIGLIAMKKFGDTDRFSLLQYRP